MRSEDKLWSLGSGQEGRRGGGTAGALEGAREGLGFWPLTNRARGVLGVFLGVFLEYFGEFGK